jgi:hypothetical protein
MGHNAVFGNALLAVVQDLVKRYGLYHQTHYQSAEIHNSILKACHILERDYDYISVCIYSR